MINTELRDTFLRKHAANCSPDECYRLFRYYFTRYSNGGISSQAQSFGNCLGYLKKLVTTHKPEECIRVVYNSEGWDFKTAIVELEYIYLTYTIALIEYYYRDYQSCVHWAKKALSLIDYFHPVLNQRGKEDIIQQNPYYSGCIKLRDECKAHYNPEMDQHFILGWEREFYFPTSHANENCKHLWLTE